MGNRLPDARRKHQGVEHRRGQDQRKQRERDDRPRLRTTLLRGKRDRRPGGDPAHCENEDEHRDEEPQRRLVDYAATGLDEVTAKGVYAAAKAVAELTSGATGEE